jgi:hypothetical protein
MLFLTENPANLFRFTGFNMQKYQHSEKQVISVHQFRPTVRIGFLAVLDGNQFVV